MGVDLYGLQAALLSSWRSLKFACLHFFRWATKVTEDIISKYLRREGA